MKELVYFSNFDLMIMVEYHALLCEMRYVSRRAMALQERVMVEYYLLTQHAQKVGYYNTPKSVFIYAGINAKLPQMPEEKAEDVSEVVLRDAESAVNELLKQCKITVR